MNTLVLLAVCLVILLCGYIFYGRWLVKQWGVGEGDIPTPAHTMEDGVDYVPAKAPVLMGHHFSSIAGAGPITGPIAAAMFGWLPVTLWVLVGGIFFGGVHDFGALFASVRHNGQSIGEIIEANMSKKAKQLFIIFSYLTLILVVAAFAAIVASTFGATFENGVLNEAKSATPASVAMVSILFIVIAIIFGFTVYRRHASFAVSTLCGVAAIVICMAVGMNFHPFYFTTTTWMWLVGLYITIASVTPVWILLQPRDYLSSFLLYAMLIVAIIGIVGAHPDINPDLFPAFTNFVVTNKAGTQYLFIAYGGMLLECVLAIITLCAIAYARETGHVKGATDIFAGGIAAMIAAIPGFSGMENIMYTLLVLTYAFCLTSLDTATRLARFMFQEFWLEPGQTPKDIKGGFKKLMVNPYFATILTVILGIMLGMGGFAKIWGLFGAANQLLAAIGLIAVAAWLGNAGKNNKMFLVPMSFMLVVTISSLAIIVKNQTGMIMKGAADWGPYAQAIIGALLIILALQLAVEGYKTVMHPHAEKKVFGEPTETQMDEGENRIADFGLREGVPLTGHEFYMGTLHRHYENPRIAQYIASMFQRNTIFAISGI